MLKKIKNKVEDKIAGAVLRPVHFEPVHGKWMGQHCKGFQIHITDREKFNSYS